MVAKRGAVSTVDRVRGSGFGVQDHGVLDFHRPSEPGVLNPEPFRPTTSGLEPAIGIVRTMSYLGNLTLRLAAGAMQLPDSVRRRQAAFLADAQNDDGGFIGREGPSDLYYTGFALRGLALLGELSEQLANRAAAFLEKRLADELSSIDFLSLVYSAVLLEAAIEVDVFAAAGRDRFETVTAALDRFRRDDGGYAKTERSGHSSTYHTFLAVSCRQLIGATVERPERTIELIRSQRREDGGFVELNRLALAGTNPTAAAVGVLRLLNATDDSICQGAAQFLIGMQNAEGGFRANSRIPVADLLSTFTSLVALADLGALERADLPAARRYAEALAQPSGGFSGGAWDDAADVEYTFYGLGVMALLASAES